MCLHVWKGTSVLLEWCPDLCLCICVPWATTALSTLLLRCLACQDTIKTELGRVHARPAKAAFTALDIRILHRWMALLCARKDITAQVRPLRQYLVHLGLLLVTLDSNIAIRALRCTLVLNPELFIPTFAQLVSTVLRVFYYQYLVRSKLFPSQQG